MQEYGLLKTIDNVFLGYFKQLYGWLNSVNKKIFAQSYSLLRVLDCQKNNLTLQVLFKGPTSALHFFTIRYSGFLFYADYLQLNKLIWSFDDLFLLEWLRFYMKMGIF